MFAPSHPPPPRVLQTYTCSQCRETFESVSALSSHTLSAHSSHAAAARGMASTRPSGGSRAATSTPSQATAKISCPMCPFEAYTEAVVSMHVNSAHFDSPANSFNAANDAGGDAEAPSGVFAASDDRTQPTAPLVAQATRAGFAPAAAVELHPERTAPAVGTFSAGPFFFFFGHNSGELVAPDVQRYSEYRRDSQILLTPVYPGLHLRHRSLRLAQWDDAERGRHAGNRPARAANHLDRIPSVLGARLEQRERPGQFGHVHQLRTVYQLGSRRLIGRRRPCARRGRIRRHVRL